MANEPYRYVECKCSDNEHVLRFRLDNSDEQLCTEVLLNPWLRWHARALLAVRYVFRYHSIGGQWESATVGRQEASKLRVLIDELEPPGTAPAIRLEAAPEQTNVYIECKCHSPAHLLRFAFGYDDEICMDVFLNPWLRWHKRAWRAIRYLFGYHCDGGHWDCTLIDVLETRKLRALIDKMYALESSLEDAQRQRLAPTASR